VASAAGFSDVATLFGESASRVVVSVAAQREAELLAMAASAHLPARRLGAVGGKRVQIAIEGRMVIDQPLGEVERTWGTAIERYFERAKALA
jgi:phosphoribosylformylglycinamidine synthase